MKGELWQLEGSPFQGPGELMEVTQKEGGSGPDKGALLRVLCCYLGCLPTIGLSWQITSFT